MADPVAIVHTRGNSGALDSVRNLLAAHRADPVAGLPPFQGGAAGFIGYDWGLTLERLPAPRYDDLALPDVVLGIYDWVIAWDHVASRAWLISTGMPETSADARATRARERASMVLAWLRGNSDDKTPGLQGKARPALRERAPSFPVDREWWPLSLELRSSFGHQGYLDAVQRVREYIFA